MTTAVRLPPAEVDVLIVGGGLVGLSLLGALRPLGLSVVLCERAAPVGTQPAGADWDSRVFAISPGSVALLESIGAWQRLPRARTQPIESMRVFGDDGAVLEFSAYDAGEPALAWIVENRELLAALVAVVEDAAPPAAGDAREGAIVTGEAGGRAVGSAMRGPCSQRIDAELASLDYDDATHVGVGFVDGSALDTKLLVGADGFHSATRRLAGIASDLRPYGQTAVVANFDCERPHHGRAWQWFRGDGGVLALLPLPGHRTSIVWSAPDALASDLETLSPERLADRVAEASGHALGHLRLTEGPVTFPLGIVRTASPCGRRAVLAGDAAHGIHPLAGQGVNLGFGDVAALARVLGERGPIADVGTELLLDRYQRLRAEPVRAMQAVTDGLWRLFNARAPGLRGARNLGMQLLDTLPWVKRRLVQPALR